MESKSGERRFVSFHDQIARNKRNSYLLFVLIFVVMLCLAFVIAQIYNPELTFVILIFAVIFSVGYTWYTYQHSAEIVIKSVKAYSADGPQFRHLRNMVEGLALGSGLPAPKTYVMPTKEINAFATGKDPEHAVVCVTEGTLEQLSDAELEAVLAHEMTHVANYDIRFVTLVGVMVGVVAIVSQIFLRSMWFGGGRGGGRGRGNSNAAFLVLAIVLAIVAPLIVKIVQLAISRKREFAADAGSVQLTRNPDSMISALKKIDSFYKGTNKRSDVNSAVAPLFLADPVKSRLTGFFNTHPPIEKRINALESM